MIHLAGALAGLILGAILGSFIAALCLRWPEGRSVLRGRSACDGCGQPLRALQLIPILSAAASRGRARCCGAEIDPFHLRTEVIAALLGTLALGLAPSLQGLALAAFGWLLLPLFLLDLRHFWLPDPLNLTLALAAFALAPFLNDVPLVERVASGLGIGLGLALLGWAYQRIRKRQGLGGGDPKLLGAVGFWLGAMGALSSLIGAALLGLAEALIRRRARDEALPFGTFLSLAAWLVALGQVVGGPK